MLRFGLWEGDLLDWMVGLSHGFWLWHMVMSWLRVVVMRGFRLWSIVLNWLWHMAMVMVVVMMVVPLDWLRLWTEVLLVVVVHSLREWNIDCLWNFILE